jgi:5-methylcytosine-specific restriction enzyme subunit McrC
MHMLTVARMVPCRSLDASSLTTLRGPLLESFVQLFAETLRTELLRGLPHAYLRYEEDLRVLRGRLDAGRQITQLAAHRDRFACRYDVFTPDTGLNRVLKAACRYVLPALRTVGAQEAVATCISLLDDVRDVGDPLAAARHVLIDRQTERLRESFDFACLLLEQQRPGLSGGQTRAISLVFDMPHLFEAYVGQVLAREAPRRLRGFRVGLQGRGHRRFLCESGGRGILQLQPDIVVDRGDDLVVVDTKWKCSREGTFGRWVPAREDLFQMHAYQHRYGAAHGVLLYPETGEAVHQEFRMVAADGSPGVPLLVRFVPLHEELWHGVGRQTVVDAVCQAVAGRMRGAEVELETAAP